MITQYSSGPLLGIEGLHSRRDRQLNVFAVIGLTGHLIASMVVTSLRRPSKRVDERSLTGVFVVSVAEVHPVIDLFDHLDVSRDCKVGRIREVPVGTSVYPLVVDLGALVVSSSVMVGIGTYLFERIEAT
jgi:hypothetical protein